MQCHLQQVSPWGWLEEAYPWPAARGHTPQHAPAGSASPTLAPAHMGSSGGSSTCRGTANREGLKMENRNRSEHKPQPPITVHCGDFAATKLQLLLTQALGTGIQMPGSASRKPHPYPTTFPFLIFAGHVSKLGKIHRK